MTLRRCNTGCPLLFVLLSISCDQGRPFAPDAGHASLAASRAGGLGAPSNVTSTAISPRQIDVTWTSNSHSATGFEIHRATDRSDIFSVLATTASDVTAYSDVGLTLLTQYCYKVRAFKTSGNTTSYSAFSMACAMTPGPPPAPSYTEAKPESSSEVSVRWSDNSYTEDGFRLERSTTAAGPWTPAATTGANATSVNDPDLTSEQQVCYRVLAFNAHGESAPSNADCTRPPAGPTNLAALQGIQGTDLAWTDNSAVEHGYEVERAADGVTFSWIANLPANTTSYHDGTAMSNTTYRYRVRARRDGGVSDVSNVASAVGSCTPTSETEICDNGVDDDCNGLADLGVDPNCGYGDECPCALGYACNDLGFCVSHCGDGDWNGDETDVDCGGLGCDAKCQTGQRCWHSSDCASGLCGGTGICLEAGGQP